jgi:hypothetical protein
MFHRPSRRTLHEEAGHEVGHRPDDFAPPDRVRGRDDGLLASPEGAARLVVAARLLRDSGQEVEACLALEALGWEQAEDPARRLLDGVLRALQRRLGPTGALRHLRGAATRTGRLFELDTEVFETLGLHSVADAVEETGLRRDYLVLCTMALTAELLRGEGQQAA